MLLFFVALVLVGAGIFWKMYKQEPSNDNAKLIPSDVIVNDKEQSEKSSILKEKAPEAIDTSKQLKVNTAFPEPAEMQVAWMERGQEVAVELLPGANRAEFQNVFYHRGDTYKPVTCGEVQAWYNDDLVADFQRFIYVGIRSAFFETDVENFDIYWQKMCVQLFEDN